MHTKVCTPSQNGAHERGFETLKYKQLTLDEIDDVLTFVERAENYRIVYKAIRPHEASA